MTRRINLDPEGCWPSVGFPMHHGVVEPAGRRVHLTGQVAWDAEGRVLAVGDAGAQTEIVLDHIERILAAAGGTLADVVSILTHLTRHEDWAAITAVRARRFALETGPASTAVLVAGLVHPDLLVEITATAIIPEDRVIDPGDGR